MLNWTKPGIPECGGCEDF